MITKAKSRSNARQLAQYLLFEEPGEQVEVAQMRGFAARHLNDAAIEMELLAGEGSRATNPFYHMQARCAPGEHLTRDQWLETADRLEAALGLDGHQRWVVFHSIEGERHLHVVWNRVHPDTLKCAHMGHDYAKRMEVARQLEQEFGLRAVPFNGRTATFNQAEMEQARRQEADPAEIRAAIREAWQQSKSGRGFADALDERGFMLAKGDRRDFVAVDAFGHTHSIGKRTTGSSAAEVRTKLGDIDPAQIPTVEQARGFLEYAQAQLSQRFNETGGRRDEEDGRGRGDQGSQSGGGQAHEPPPIVTLREKQEREQRRHDLLQRRESRRAATILKAAQAEADRKDRKPTKAESAADPDAAEGWRQRQAARATDTAAAMRTVQQKIAETRAALAERQATQVEMMRYWMHRAGMMAEHWKKWLSHRAMLATAAVKRGQEWAKQQHVRTARQNRTDQETREMLDSLPPEQRAEAEAQIQRQNREAKRKAASAEHRKPSMVHKPDMRSDTWKFDR